MFRNNYSGSRCPKCENRNFEVVEETPTNSNFKLEFVRCSSCKTVVGVVEFFNNGHLLHKLAKALNINLDR